MKTRKLVRRSLFTAALSTASMISTLTADAYGLDSKSPSSGNQQVQSQKTQNTAQPGTAIEAELRKMFNESGQPMPSMRPQDLPNANVIHPSQMKPANGAATAQNPGGQNRPSQSVKSPVSALNEGNGKATTSGQPKKNFLQKFLGKVTGREKKEAEAAVIPPVPPGYKEQPQTRPADATRRIAGISASQTSTPDSGQDKMTAPAMQDRAQQSGNRSTTSSQGVAKSNAATGGIRNRDATGDRSMLDDSMINGEMSPVPHRPKDRHTTASNSSQHRSAHSDGRQGENSLAGRPTNMGRLNPSGQVDTNQSRSAGKEATPVSSPRQPIPQIPFRLHNATASSTEETTSKPSAGNQTDGPRYIQPGAAPSFMAGAGVTTVPAQAALATPPATQTRVAAPNVATKETVDQALVPTDKAPADTPDDFEMPFADVEDSGEVLDLDAVKSAVPEISGNSSPESDLAQNSVPKSTTATIEVAPAVRVPVEAAKDSSKGVRVGEADVRLNIGVTLPPVDSDEKESFGEAAPPMQEFTDNLPSMSVAAEDATGVASMDSNSILLPPVEPSEEDAAGAGPETPVTSSTTDPSSTTSPSAIDITETAPARSVDAELLQQTAEQERLLRQQRQIQARAGQPGFKGFCPVTLRDKRELVDADPSMTGTFGLQTYTFANAEAKTAFEADPSRYAPAAGGSDIVLLVNSGEEQPGMLDYALWYRDRLYMFRSRETMAAFSQDPQRFANQY